MTDLTYNALVMLRCERQDSLVVVCPFSNLSKVQACLKSLLVEECSALFQPRLLVLEHLLTGLLIELDHVVWLVWSLDLAHSSDGNP